MGQDNDSGVDQDWQQAISTVIPNVVSIEACSSLPFDSQEDGVWSGTGFVVDAEKGLILTNRHAIGPGPVTVRCTFQNGDQVDADVVWIHDIHDFGFLQYNPKKVTGATLKGLKLRPEVAKVGLDVRAAGNEGREKLSIMSGVLSRLDRTPPEYAGGYSDFNINYYQVNFAAGGGSSGSPIFSKNGEVVGLICGYNRKSTNLAVPLELPVRALAFIQNGTSISCGDIQAKFEPKPLSRCCELGLTDELVAAIRMDHPDVAHLLVASRILPSGPSDGNIQEGDIIVQVDGKYITQPLGLEEILDRRVGQTLKFCLRRGTSDIEKAVDVGNLHDITPNRLVQVWGATFHAVSYQQAMRHTLPVSGVCCANLAGSWTFDRFEHDNCIIDSVDHKPTPDLDTFIEVIKEIPDGARVTVSYKQFDLPGHVWYDVISVNRELYPSVREVIRNDKTHVWDTKAISTPPSSHPQHARPFVVSPTSSYLVEVECSMLLGVDSHSTWHSQGWGTIVGSGLVIVGRKHVPHMFCWVTVIIGHTRLPAKIMLLHPLWGFAVIQYDAKQHGYEAILSDKPAQKRDTLTFIGHDANKHHLEVSVAVTQVVPISSPIDLETPSYRLTNCEQVIVDKLEPCQRCDHGALLTMDGKVKALWLSHSPEEGPGFAIPAPSLLPYINAIREGRNPPKSLCAEFDLVTLDKASGRGVPVEWISNAEQASRTHLFAVLGCTLGFQQETRPQLQHGDILLSLDGKEFPSTLDLTNIDRTEEVDVVVVRAGKQLSLSVPLMNAKDVETDHVVKFLGATVQRPPLAVRQQAAKMPSEVYVAAVDDGSPADFWDLPSLTFITHINYQLIPTLSDFVQTVQSFATKTDFTVTIRTLNDTKLVVSMKNDNYYPLKQWMKGPDYGVRF